MFDNNSFLLLCLKEYVIITYFSLFYIILFENYFIFSENQSKVNLTEFMYGYHSSQITLYTTEDGKRFIKIIIPAIRTLFQFIVIISFIQTLKKIYYNINNMFID